SLPNSSMRSWIAPSYMGSETRQAQATAQAAHATADRAHLLLGQLPYRLGHVVRRGQYEVFQRLDIVRVDRLGIDVDRSELARAGGRDRDQAATRGAGHLGLAQLGLSVGELLLHLLRLLHELLQVGLSAWTHGTLLSLAEPQARGALTGYRNSLARHLSA